MRPRRAVPKIPTGPSVPCRLPFYNTRHFLSHSESTLAEVLIPLHFNSSRIIAYKKPGEGVSPSDLNVWQLVTPNLFPRFPQPTACAHTGNPATRLLSCVYLITRGYPGVVAHHVNEQSDRTRSLHFV